MRIFSSASKLFVALAFPILASAQLGSPSCTITAVPALVRAEGVAERLGDIVISCSGTPGREITGNLTLTITAVTNRLIGGTALDVVLTVNSGAGEVQANAPATLAGNNQITFSGLRFNIGVSGTVSLRIANLRGDASFGGVPVLPPQFGSALPTGTSIVAQLAFSGGLLNFTNTNFTVGVSQRGLYATTLSTVVPNQLGSPLPDPVGFTELIRRGTLFASTRVSEGFSSAFEPRQEQSTNGTRILMRFSGYPSDARLFVPLAVAGSNAATPTRAGDFGGIVSGGRHQNGSRTLLLNLVVNADANGSGGYAAAASSGDDGSFNTMAEVTLSNGSGVAVYEVMDASPQVQESAQIPVFIGLPRSGQQRNSTLALQVSFAPISTAPGTSPSAPTPRFVNLNAPSDCGLFRDCEQYIPRLDAPPVNTTFNLMQGVGVEQRLIPLGNLGGGLMPWTATIEYKSARGWIHIDPTSGLEPLLIRMIVTARTEMQPGTYEATLIIDAGSAGVARYPINLRVLPIPEIPKPKPAVSSVVHGATFASGPIARGAFITLRGTNLAGAGVTIDGKAARVVYSSNDQINAQVPNDLAGSTAAIVVTVAGVASDPVTVNVATVAPGIFNPGIVNQDGSINSASNPANTGSYLQVYATGLLPPEGQGIVEARVHDRVLTNLPYAGNAPGIPGLQQVNLQVPADLPTMLTELQLCVTAGGQRVCSAPAQVHLRYVQQ